MNCQAKNYVIQNFNPNFEIKNSVIKCDSGETNAFGAIQILSFGTTSIINTRFINLNKDSIINYNHANKATSDNSITIDDCRFEICYGCCIYLNVESESLDNIHIDGCTFDSCKKGTDQSMAVGDARTSDSISLTVDSCKFNNCGSKQGSGYVFYWDVNKEAIQAGAVKSTIRNNTIYYANPIFLDLVFPHILTI